MQAPEEFLNAYFLNRTQALEEYFGIGEPDGDSRFRAFNDLPMDCQAAIRNSERERVLNLTRLKKGCEIVTSGPEPALGRFKYRLVASGGTWRIHRIERECAECHGSGWCAGGGCGRCGGEGWSTVLKLPRRLVAPQQPTIACLIRRIKREPRNAELHQVLGHLYLKQGRVVEARVAYERSVELDPCDPWTHLFLGNWHYAVDEHAEAVECFKYAARLLPNVAAPFWCLGDAYAALGFDALATENYRRGLDVDPEDETAKKRWRKWRRTSRPKD